VFEKRARIMSQKLDVHPTDGAECLGNLVIDENRPSTVSDINSTAFQPSPADVS